MGHMRPTRAAVSAAMLAILAASYVTIATAQALQIIELHYRLADQILPALQPLVEPGGVLTGTESTLFVRTSPANFEQIRQAVAQLDRKPRDLLISVGQGTVRNVEDSGVRGSATIGSDDVQVGVNRPPSDDTSVSAAVRHVAQQADLHNVSSVRAIEGNEAFISIGQLVPLTTTQVTPGYHGPVVQQSTEFHDVSTGFYATVRTDGDVVTLDISPRQQRLRNSTYGPVVETAGATSTLSGRLGEWLPLGAVRESAGNDSSGLLVWGRRSVESQYGAWVKVDEVE
jgi:type II secretory pathway component GspD/PulD (secretin)